MTNHLDEARKQSGEPSAYGTRVGRPASAYVPRSIAEAEVTGYFDSPGLKNDLTDHAFKTAIGAVAKTIMEDEQLSKAFNMPGGGVMPGSSWSNQGTINTALIARVSQNLAANFQRTPGEVEVALAEHGLTWGPPFPPGRPLDPFYGYRRPPRTWNFQVGENVQITPRWNRISFGTLRSIIESYYAAQVCIRHLINDVRSLDYQFVPPANVLEDATDDIQKAEEFFASPDKQRPFRLWLHKFLQDVLRYDAGTLYIRRNEAGDPIALEVIDGTTMIPLVDYFGRPPADETDADADPEGIWWGDTTPAFVQIIQGLPWVWLAEDDIIYQPIHPMPESQYGLAPMEAVLMQANTDIRFQWHFLQYFTEGSVPAGFMEAPPDLSDPIQVALWQEAWDGVMLGDQAQLRQIRWVPAGASFTATKEGTFEKEFPLYLMRCTAAAFGVTANDLGFTEDVNRATGEVQVDVQFRVGTLPLVRYVEDVINLFIVEHLKLKARIAFDTGQGTQHRYETAQANDIYIKNGTLSNDEVRISLGKRISREMPTPRFYDNTRAGPIPLASVYALAGDIDPTTYGPAKGSSFEKYPFFSAAGVAPVIGSDDYKTAQDATANMQRGMLGLPPIPPDPTPAPAAATSSSAAKDIAAELFSLMKGVDNTGGPGVKPMHMNPPQLDAETGAHGVDLVDLDEDENEDWPQKQAKKTLSQIYDWRRNSRNRVLKGKPPRPFSDLPPFVTQVVWPRLEKATTLEEVNKAFEGDFLSPKDLARKGREAAGILVQALDTKRVLLVQRTPDKHDDRGAYARWEFPGGRLDDTDVSIWAGARREWQEETGARLPDGSSPCGGWLSDDEAYEGFVVCIPSESDVGLDPQPEEVSAARWWNAQDLDDPKVRDKVQEQLDSIQPLLKAGLENFHIHADEIVDYYSPIIRDTMAGVLAADSITQATRASYRATKGLPHGAVSHNVVRYDEALRQLQSGAPDLLRHVDTAPLGKVLRSLHGDAMLAGAREAMLAGGFAEGPFNSLLSKGWEPGQGDIAAELADGGLADLLHQAGVTIKGIAETEVRRIGDAIAKGVDQGWSEDEIATAIDAIVHDPDRAHMIAETEYMRAATAAHREVYKRNGVTEVAWIHQPGACPACMKNAKASPIPITSKWPSGPVPVHPWCRCVEVPYVDA